MARRWCSSARPVHAGGVARLFFTADMHAKYLMLSCLEAAAISHVQTGEQLSGQHRCMQYNPPAWVMQCTLQEASDLLNGAVHAAAHFLAPDAISPKLVIPHPCRRPIIVCGGAPEDRMLRYAWDIHIVKDH